MTADNFAAKVAKYRAAAEAAATAPAEPTVKVWVPWFIAQEVIATRGHKSLAAKLSAKRPSKYLDRTVRLTRDECDQLMGIAVKVEQEARGVAPQVAYSAFSLRGLLVGRLAESFLVG